MNDERLDTLLDNEFATAASLPDGFMQNLMMRVGEERAGEISAETIPFTLHLTDFLLPLISAALFGTLFLLWLTGYTPAFDVAMPITSNQLTILVGVVLAELLIGAALYLGID